MNFKRWLLENEQDRINKAKRVKVKSVVSQTDVKMCKEVNIQVMEQENRLPNKHPLN